MTKLFKNILYVSEASVAQGSSIARAVSVAENNQAGLTVIDVTPDITPDIGMLPAGRTPGELQAIMVSERRKELGSLIEPYMERLDIQLDVLVGKTYIEVIRTILRDNYDLMIKPAENPNFIERLFGSDDVQLLRNCPCPVWLTRSEEQSDYTRILAAVDVNPDVPDAPEQTLNRQILELSSSLAISKFAALDVVHVWDAPFEMKVQSWSDNPREASMAYVEGERSRHERAFNRLGRNFKDQIGPEAYDHLGPQFHLRRGAPSRVIPQTVKEFQADLVVMGTVARTGIAGWLIGNTAEAILEQLQCSVLAVKPPGFVSPVKLSE
ncbi:Nucleotide-binding universal stress protein, UspA family [Nitrosomonas sp. Nm51]|uniref:universal stress protein n=1 Tax=Nitrosomonas sp. Nm51 TaxID=133720 RepID=UPI0008B7C3D8|nr:universal stress protein [Nitrosomonas sp. Nm51]SEQ90648.1 Nucleotide-binding universal stress protein, UspA family [Nitrosomonas sp. Nm51]